MHPPVRGLRVFSIKGTPSHFRIHRLAYHDSSHEHTTLEWLEDVFVDEFHGHVLPPLVHYHTDHGLLLLFQSVAAFPLLSCCTVNYDASTKTVAYAFRFC